MGEWSESSRTGDEMSLAMVTCPDHTALRGCGLGVVTDVIGVLSFVGLAGLAGGLFAKNFI